MIHRLVRLLRYLASFLKSEWSLADYPVRVRELREPPALPAGSHLRPVRWSAQITGWPTVFGSGDTREEALGNLAEAFQRCVGSRKTMPRPGTEHMDIELAPSDRLPEVEDLAPRFFSEILEMNYADCLITDESSLWDFHADADNASYFDRIRAVYGVDVSDIESGCLVDILERLRPLSPSV